MIKNQQIIRTAGTVFFIFILCVIFIEPLRTRMNNIFSMKERGELKETEVIGTVAGYNPRVKEIQEILKYAHFYSGSADGFMGSRTRRAIKEFQKAKGLQVTGRIDQVTFLALNRQGEMIKSAPEPPQPQPVKEEPPKEVSESPDEIKQTQSALSKAGFYKGNIDGIMGARTKKAIKDFQRSRGLKADGVVGPKTREELKR